MPEDRRQFDFKNKRIYIAKVNIPNMTYPNQNINVETPHGWRDDAIERDTVNVTFNHNIESTHIT